MKNLIVLVGLTLLSSNVFAVTANQAQSIKIKKSFQSAGAELIIYKEASAVSITNLDCSQSGGIWLAPMKCSFVDESSGRLLEISEKKASEIVSALEAAGVEGVSKRSGSMTSLKLKVASVNCLTRVFHKRGATDSVVVTDSCEIKK